MIKKSYETPVVRKVHLVIKNSILSVCHSSMINASASVFPGCRVNNQCAMASGMDLIP